MTEERLLINKNLNPFDLFREWFEEASKKEINDPNAMSLSTLSEDNKISSRIVLLKDFNENGFVFYTNFESKKGVSILSNPNVALNFYWKSLHKQIRIEGKALKVNDKEADEYFSSRPRGSKIGAWASNQSSELSSRKKLDENFSLYNEKFFEDNVPRPPHWSGFKVEPLLIEFWQEMPSRLHDRLEYKKENNKWLARKLFP